MDRTGHPADGDGCGRGLAAVVLRARRVAAQAWTKPTTEAEQAAHRKSRPGSRKQEMGHQQQNLLAKVGDFTPRGRREEDVAYAVEHQTMARYFS